MLKILRIVDQLSFDFLLWLDVVTLVTCGNRAFGILMLGLWFLKQRCLAWWGPVSIIFTFLDLAEDGLPSIRVVIYHYSQRFSLHASPALWRGVPRFRALYGLVLPNVGAEDLTILRHFVEVYGGVANGLRTREWRVILQIESTWQDGIGVIHWNSIDLKVILGPLLRQSHSIIPETLVQIRLTPEGSRLWKSDWFIDFTHFLLLNRGLLRNMRSYIFVADLSGAWGLGIRSWKVLLRVGVEDTVWDPGLVQATRNSLV